ncbi:MAG TPA: hypothetical protein VF496_02645, partial [Candidatus Deferrimicrobium sp.]
NQIEIYFSILQRKVLTPNDFPSLEALKERLFAFERHYEAIAKPFEWQQAVCGSVLAHLAPPCPVES